MNLKNNDFILLVDDEPDLRGVLSDFLEEEGYTVVQAENGAKALEFLHSNLAPRLILLDFMMPKMDGKQFCLERNKDPNLSTIPVILLTAAKVSRDVLNSMNVQANVSKPPDIDEFLRVVKHYYSLV